MSLAVTDRVVLAADPDWFGTGTVVAVLNYGYLVTVQWPSGATTTHLAADIRRAP